jgi:hypothetical protein
MELLLAFPEHKRTAVFEVDGVSYANASALHMDALPARRATHAGERLTVANMSQSSAGPALDSALDTMVDTRANPAFLAPSAAKPRPR